MTPDRAALLELAERCEKATGPDRLLNSLITKHFRLYRSLTEPIAADRWIEMREEDGRLLLHVPGDLCAPYGYSGLPFTSSLDAAMTLVPRGWQWLRKDFSTMSCVQLTGTDRGWAKHIDGAGWLPALALCAAALRARASITPNKDETA